MLFLLPLGVSAGAAVSLGIAFTDVLPLFFDPLMMMVIGIIVMEALRRVLTSEFEARQTLGEMAATDQLTGLLNLRAIWPLLNHELQHAQRAGTPFSLILGDLDLFIKVNDTYGNDAGDLVLQETARRIHQTISLGVASFQNNDDVDAVVSRADEALYRAKHKGRNRVDVAGSDGAMPPVSD